MFKTRTIWTDALCVCFQTFYLRASANSNSYAPNLCCAVHILLCAEFPPLWCKMGNNNLFIRLLSEPDSLPSERHTRTALLPRGLPASRLPQPPSQESQLSHLIHVSKWMQCYIGTNKCSASFHILLFTRNTSVRPAAPFGFLGNLSTSIGEYF